MLYMILLILFLLCLGVVTSSFLAGFTPPENRPAFYRDEAFRKRMEWSFLPAIGLLLCLININLTYTLLIGGAAVFLSNWVLRPPAEALIVEPLHRIYAKNRSDVGQQGPRAPGKTKRKKDG